MFKVIFLSFLLYPFFCSSQVIITGQVLDSNEAIYGVSVILKDSTGNFIDYSYTNENGNYKLNSRTKGSFIIEFSSLGYKGENISIVIEKQKELKIDITLETKPFDLDEVIVKAELDITQKKDTITFNAKAFAQGNEEVVEDLLKKIPGLTVEADGTIKVGDQEVEKVMIDGDDFFERGYKLLTKNMPAQPIDKIELLQNYSNNRLLKGIEESERVALNLKLDEDAKRIWFGNMTLGYDAFSNEDRYYAKANLMNFGKKNKFYFLTNLNNIGYNATGDINHLIRPMRFNEPASIGDNQNISSLIGLSASPPNFKRSRTTFNNAEMASLNAIFNPTEKLKIKTLGFFNWDELNFFRNRIDNIAVNNLNFTNTEDYQLQNTNRIGFGKADLTYNISTAQMLEATTKYQNANFQSNSDLLFNGQSTIENVDNPVELFDQKISYTNKFKDKKVLLLTGRFIRETAPQNYSLNQFLYEDLFPSTNADNVRQTLEQKMTFTGFEAHLLDRKDNRNLLEIKLGNAYRRDVLNSKFSLLENESIIDNPQGFQNELTYSVNDLYAKGKYQYNLKAITLIGNLSVHQLFNSIDQNNQNSSQQPFFVNPSLGIDWKINKNNRIRTSYGQNRTNADVLNVYDNFILTGFRNFSSGAGEFNQLDASALFFNYQLGNWSDRFFANTTFAYTKNHDFFSTNSQINQNFTLSEAIVIKDRELFTANTSLDYFFKKLESNVKLKLGYTQSEFKNIVNNSELREVNSINYNYGFEYRTAFNGIFNFHLGSKWLTNEIKTTITNEFTDNVSFLDMTFTFNEKLNFDFNSERYYFGNLETDNTYYFLDFNARYTVKENKLTLMLSGKNLFNTITFRNFSISDIGNSTTEYRLLPRYILLKMEYRF
ncbi:carboxypeptidase-like regulatory domain-containing protein [Winogradskyella sp.]|uniref:carboxypeptidase-like regulatory domain-containing protein n=1 Tax=Winogradskyella sp. TaxID=1883156 RepID=UPI0025DA2DBA|nr:carboxypeptidase-like regulatory domain-containing protein [Winogradskyella sp.]MBT8245472.1 carboxypeptidase-like regulatory domain-containing protein [Winogradskyella sp.]